MAGSIVRLGNGQTARVRVGVLQGIGPVGPKGAKGDRGEGGPMGQQGPVGPAGSLSELLSVTTVSSPQTVPATASSELLISWGSVQQDDLGIFATATNIVPVEANGVYQMQGFVVFEAPGNPGDGYRELYVYQNRPGTDNDEIIHRSKVPAVVDGETVIPFACTFIGHTDATYTVRALSSDDLPVALSEGRLSVNRIGVGPAGPAGPMGPTGGPGPAGPQGPQGPDGDINSGFASYEAMRPD